MLVMLRDWTGFRKLVHSIGVSVKTAEEGAAVTFLMQNWGRTSKYETGTQLRVPCPGDGTEIIVRLEENEWSEEDTAPGIYAFEFGSEGELATASIVLYLNDGYTAPRAYSETPG